MISVNNAFQLIEKNAFVGETTTLQLQKSLGYVLSQDLFSAINMPPFRQSAMDGYAIVQDQNLEYSVIGESKAGIKKVTVVNKNQAVRIFTGAYVPDEATTVVMQEHVLLENKTITIEKMPNIGANIRAIGEQIKKGEQIVSKNTVLSEALIGFLASLGITKVPVYKKPSVAILVTGNELVKGGQKLKTGQIFESNSVMLKTGLQRFGVHEVKIKQVPDNARMTSMAIKKMIAKYDFVLISGGISVGDYDYVKAAIEANKVTEIFYKVNQKPGKPLFYGKKNATSLFALPGNPASSLTCFYLYVIPAIRKFMGHTQIHLPRLQKNIIEDFVNNSGKSLFLKARVEENTVHVLGSQSSAMLNSYSESNALIHVLDEQIEVKNNTSVEVIQLHF